MRSQNQITMALLISTWLLAACAGAQHAADNLSVKPLVWPQPPLAERIRQVLGRSRSEFGTRTGPMKPWLLGTLL